MSAPDRWTGWRGASSALEITLGLQRACGAPPAAIQNTMIAMAKDAYVRGDAELDYLESVVAAILRDESVVILQPGEMILHA